MKNSELFTNKSQFFRLICKEVRYKHVNHLYAPCSLLPRPSDKHIPDNYSYLRDQRTGKYAWLEPVSQAFQTNRNMHFLYTQTLSPGFP